VCPRIESRLLLWLGGHPVWVPISRGPKAFHSEFSETKQSSFALFRSVSDATSEVLLTERLIRAKPKLLFILVSAPSTSSIVELRAAMKPELAFPVVLIVPKLDMDDAFRTMMPLLPFWLAVRDELESSLRLELSDIKIPLFVLLLTVTSLLSLIEIPDTVLVKMPVFVFPVTVTLALLRTTLAASNIDMP
jgi:hypothetical protein